MNVDFRNGIVSAQPNYLTKTSGGTYSVSIATNVKDLIITASHGVSEYLVSFYSNVNSAWTFNDTDTHYLFIDIDNVTGLLSYGSSTVPVTYGASLPNVPVVGETFFNNSTFQSYQWTGDSWVKRIRVFVGSVNPSGVTVLSVGTITGSNVPYVSGSILYTGTGRGILKQDKTFMSAVDRVMINEVPFGASVIEQTALSVKAADNLAGSRFVKLNQQGYLTYANPVDVGASLIFVLTEPLNIGEVTFLPVGGVITNPSWAWSFADLPLWVGKNGEISQVDPTLANPTLPNKQPIGRTLSPTSILTNALNFLGTTPQAVTITGSTYDWSIQDADFTAEPFNGYVVDVTTGNVIVTLPTSPVVNDDVTIMLAKLIELSSNRCTINSNQLIQGTENNITIDVNYATLRFVFVDGIVGWALIVTQNGPVVSQNGPVVGV